MGTHIHLNGGDAEVEAHPETPLLWVLRDELGCVAAKYGCGAEQCGACRVLVDGQPAFSCTLPIGDLGEREVTTLESLRDTDAGTRVINALLEINAGQCGYCLPGIAVTLIHLAGQDRAEAPPLTRDDVIAALDPHLCRCGSQPRILTAALSALGV